MTDHEARTVNESQVQEFQDNGVVLLSGAFEKWIPALAMGAKFNVEHPSTSALTHQADTHAGKFLEDFCNWQRIPGYRRFVCDSTLGSIAAKLMRSKSVQFFHDHLLYKEAGSGVATPWHQDMPYYCVDGEQTVSFWIPLEARPRAVSLRCAAGSHRLPREIRPTSWSTMESFYTDDDQFMDLPDIEGGDFEIKAWAMTPGDAVAFDFRTIHGANANTLPSVNCTLSFRLVGDDVLYRQRNGRTSPNFPGIGQKTGERLREDWFPVIWESAGR